MQTLAASSAPTKHVDKAKFPVIIEESSSDVVTVRKYLPLNDFTPAENQISPALHFPQIENRCSCFVFLVTYNIQIFVRT